MKEEMSFGQSQCHLHSIAQPFAFPSLRKDTYPMLMSMPRHVRIERVKILRAYSSSREGCSQSHMENGPCQVKMTHSVLQTFFREVRSRTEISTEGKRALLLFVALKCGTSEADALNFTQKLAPDGVGFDDMDSCSSGDRDEARRPTKRSRSGVSAAESSVGTKGIQDEGMERFGNMLADAMKPILEMVPTPPSVPTTAAPASTGDIDILLQKLEEVAEKLHAGYDREENDEARIADQ
jgi:hypothetical protein